MSGSIDGRLGMKTLVGIPMLNSQDCIASVVLLAVEHVDEVVCVDDGSTDDSVYLAESAGAKVIQHRSNRGVGGVQRTIFEYAKKNGVDALILLDSDGQHNPDDIPKILSKIESNEADVVIGSRYIEGGGSKDMPLYRRFGLWIINMMSRLHSSEIVHDTQSGFRGFGKNAISTLNWESDGMESSLQTLESASHNKMRIFEVPVMIRYDVPKSSSIHPLPHGMTVLGYAVMTLSQKRPLIVFGVPGIVLLLFGAFFGLGAVNFVDVGGLSVGRGLLIAWIGALGIPLVIAGIALHFAARSLGRNLTND